MKYTKLFNNHDEYVAYTSGTAFIRPNVSYCIQEDEPHCTPAEFKCQDNHVYEVIGEPSYPETVAASATSFTLSFDYKDTHTLVSCEVVVTTDTDSVSVAIEENPSTESRTISGSYNFHGIAIPYSLTQEGMEDLPYDQQYLTFNVLTDGVIRWKSFGSNMAKTISYSINDGNWTEITATSSGVTINVEQGDKVRFKGTNPKYASDKSNYSGFDSSGLTNAAQCNIEGNIMSLVYGDNFIGNTAMTGTYNFCSIFKASKVVSAENLVLPSTTLTQYCYRAMFSWCESLIKAPQLPATTLAQGCYWYMFEYCAITTAPDLEAPTLVNECYGHMFEHCSSLNYIKALATSGFNTSKCKEGWTTGVASNGTFIKSEGVTTSTWNTGVSGIPTNWTVKDETTVKSPTISFDGFSVITLSCETEGADIFYKLNNTGDYSAYTTAIVINEDTFIETYAELNSESSNTTSQTCVYVSDIPIEYSNRDLKKWQYSGNTITTPYSVNAIDGHSSNYAKGTFNFETSFALKGAEPTYLWFQHADQSAEIFVDGVSVEKHWGGYNAFFVDISDKIHNGTNNIKVALKNNEGNVLAPYAGDFNFNATLGNVKLFTSSYIPSMDYGYDGFHITSNVSTAEATINVKTSIPTGATVVCTISGVNCNYTATSASTSAEMIFSTTITNPRLWNGTIDPYLYNVKLEIYHDNVLYHRYERPYGLRFFEYVINQTVNGDTYTGLLLNGQPYLLRGVCMHDDIVNKANALNDADYTQEFNIIKELGCNFIRLAHYPHPKEVYDKCDELGIIVQTEAPWVNKSTTAETEAYWTHLSGQCEDMVSQHYNHPCIVFWGVGNEINTTYTNTTEGKNFVKGKIESYRSLIRSLLPNALVGYTVSHGTQNALGEFNYPTVDWVGNNIYVGWYIDKTSNNPTNRLNTAINNATGHSTPCAFSEYGCGGTQACHSDGFMTTTTTGNNPRHDIEYMMWLHEGHIAAIKNLPQLMFTSQWQLFDIAVSSRNEGFTECLDGDNASINDSLRRLNNKGLVERDHVTRKDPFYLYKAWWNPTPFVHICQKNFTRRVGRTIKCYSNDGDTFNLYVNGTLVDTATATDNIVLFAPRTFNNGDVIKVSGSTSTDEFTMPTSPLYDIVLTTKYNVTDTVNPTIIGGSGYVLSFEEIEIDGVKQQNVTSAHTFSTTGEHTVKYKLDNTSIDYYALNGCSNITDIEIPNGVTMLKDGCFKECTSLTSVTMSNNITLIENSVFKGCSNLLNVTIPNSVTSIGEGVFSGCTNLESISIGSGITAFSMSNLDDCHNILSIIVESGNTVYDSRNNCNAIIKKSNNSLIRGCQNTIIPSDVTSIGQDAFKGCYGLTSIVISDNVTSIGGGAFRGCYGLTSIVIPNSVTSIGGYAFQNCRNLTSITIPNSVRSIGVGTFDACYSLTSCTIGSGVTNIGDNAFTSCSGLTNIVIPNSVTSIGNGAFNGCRSLTSIVCNATTAPTISNTTFRQIKTDGTLTVPSGSSGYDVWMGTGNYYLGLYNWTKVEQV